MLTKLLHNFTKIHKLQIYRQLKLTAITSKINSTDTNAINPELFSEEDKEKILKIVNCDNIENLTSQYSITKKLAQNLELHRVNNGPYSLLEDLCKVKGINNKNLYKFYKSIILGKKITQHRKLTRGLVLTPKTNADKHENVNKVLGIYIGQDMLSWALLSRDCEVLQWNYKNFPKNFTEDQSKKNLHYLLEIVLPILANLPKAERYIMQECGGDIGYQQSKKLYHAYIKESIINAIILSYLTTTNCKFDDICEFVRNNVFILRQHVLRKIYGLVVENETISTQYMIHKLMQENDELMQNKDHLPSVLIRTELRNMYSALPTISQEQISWPLLIALAFLELIVHQRSDMILRNVI